MIDSILRLYAERGARAYFGEPVSLLEHSLQTAAIASGAGAPASLVAAALLHDVGHVLADLPENSAETGVDDRHEQIVGAYLAGVFPESVCEPIRLHVAAKRYLCAADPAYFRRLSEASVLSLGLQGGPMSEAEARAFVAHPFASDAVRLRGWDEAAKVAGARTPELEHFRALLESLAISPK
jgi:phosphonate degradation associated HDIG domain protein